MIITFCGHSDYIPTPDDEERVLSLLERIVGDGAAEFFLGGYGAFDHFAYNCCKQYKQTHPRVSLVFVTPYIREAYLKGKDRIYDEIVYPEIGDKPQRFAISYRNKYMVEKADRVIAYVSHDWGGAYATYKLALKKGKIVYNLAYHA